ncbi:hypothetical protein [Metamycoplasma cloacale]|nr:hypothetical protein [Metamycoplasma cloacale]
MVLIQKVSDGKTTPEDFLKIYEKMDAKSKEMIFLVFYNALLLKEEDFRKVINLDTFDLSKDLKIQFKQRIHWDALMGDFEKKYKRIRHSFLQEKTYVEFLSFIEEILKDKFKDYLYYKEKQHELALAGAALSLLSNVPFIGWLVSIASISCYTGSLAMGSMAIKTKHNIQNIENELEEFTNYWLEFGTIENPTNEQLRKFDERLRNFYITLSNTIQFKTLEDRAIFDNLFVNLYTTSETKTDQNKIIDKKTMCDLYAIFLKYNKTFQYRYKFDKNDEISIFFTTVDILMGLYGFVDLLNSPNSFFSWNLKSFKELSVTEPLQFTYQISQTIFENISKEREEKIYSHMYDFYEHLKNAFENFWMSPREYKDEVIFLKRIMKAISTSYVLRYHLGRWESEMEHMLEGIERLLPWDYYMNIYSIY